MSDPEWQYQKKDFDETRIPEGSLGFVYLITNKISGRKYIGKKLLVFRKTAMKNVLLKSGVKKKKKVTTLYPSDWKEYWGSSESLLKDIASLGSENFVREILFFCSSKGSMSYWELQEQMDARALEQQDKFYNGICNARVAHSHLKPKLYPL